MVLLHLLDGGHGEVAVAGEDRPVPAVLELLHDRGIRDLLVPGERIRLRAHVAGALHVVLATDGVDAATTTAELAVDHCYVRQTHDAFSARGMLGDAEAVDDGGRTRRAVQLGCSDEIPLIDVADLGNAGGRVALHHLRQLIEAARAL